MEFLLLLILGTLILLVVVVNRRLKKIQTNIGVAVGPMIERRSAAYDALVKGVDELADLKKKDVG
jgi:hypothetical protein